MKGTASRKLAVEVLIKIEQQGAFANKALQEALKSHSLSERDRAFATFIVHGSLRHQFELDKEISKYSRKALAKLSPSIRAVLRMAFYQLLHMQSLPPSAVINTAVEIARKTGHEGSAKFVNGILRAYTKEHGSPEKSKEQSSDKETASACAPANETENMSLGELSEKYSLPQWLLARWLKRYGLKESMLLLRDTQQIPYLTLRVSEISISTEGLMQILSSKGMELERSRLYPTCIHISHRGPNKGPLSKLPGYDEGLFTIQDDASALVSAVLAPAPGQCIVDLCAAPGGKTLHLAELMENKGRVIAVDKVAKRLEPLSGERQRLKLTNIEIKVMDGCQFVPEAPVDAVLIDAPCSGTGVIRRRSDLRMHRQESDLAALVSIQRSLLDSAAGMIKVGGILVYSTCSIEPEENQENMNWFLDKHKEFRTENLTAFLPKETLAFWASQEQWSETSRELASGSIQLLPSRHGSSGFFICRLKKES